MADANKPANPPSPRLVKQNPSGEDTMNSVERSIPDSEQVAAPETSLRLGERAGGVGAPENQGVTIGEPTTEDAEQANHLKDEFLATVSHELRTPMNAVLGWARMLGSKQLPPDRASHAIATIERNASALAHLIDDLLDVSRIVAGTLHLAPQPVDLVAVAQAALDAVRPLAATKTCNLRSHPISRHSNRSAETPADYSR